MSEIFADEVGFCSGVDTVTSMNNTENLNNTEATLTLMAEYKAFAAHLARHLDSVDAVEGLNVALDQMMAYAARGFVGRFDYHYDKALLISEAALDAQTWATEQDAADMVGADNACELWEIMGE